ncbi:MAG: hypothetical protein IKL06_08815 [Lachnospiraceae bacterium]|nr:hypothetical protein [Lachnospiraceae bacterium]
MNKYRHPKSSLFFMEIMIHILFFVILVTVCLQLFFKAHNLSETASALPRAVTTCSSIAEVYQSNLNGSEIILTIFPDAIALNNATLIYFDKEYYPCKETDCTYRAVLEHVSSSDANITLYHQGSGEILYAMTVSSYVPSTLADLKGGSRHEEN